MHYICIITIKRNNMTEREKELILIAIEIIELNQDLNLKLTGGLLLALKGVNKRREATDIDFISDCLCEEEEGYPNMPINFKCEGIDGSRSEVDAIQFKNIDGLKIEFMYSNEDHDASDDYVDLDNYSNPIPCAKIKYLINAKKYYASNDLNEISKSKHILDIAYLIDNNSEYILNN